MATPQELVTSPEPMEVQGVGDGNIPASGGPGGPSGPPAGVVDLTQSDSGRERESSDEVVLTGVQQAQTSQSGTPIVVAQTASPQVIAVQKLADISKQEKKQQPMHTTPYLVRFPVPDYTIPYPITTYHTKLHHMN